MKKLNLITILLLVLNVLVILAFVFLMSSCKKKDDPTPKCDISSFSGTWAFVVNKDRANQYNDTLILQWSNNTYICNGEICNNKYEVENYAQFSNSKHSFVIDKLKCVIIYDSGSEGKKL